MIAVSDRIYELCRPVLADAALDEEDKPDKLEAILRQETTLQGRPLEDAILAVLWRHRDATTPARPAPPPVSSPASRAAHLRRSSPAPWQVPRAVTPGGSGGAGGSPSLMSAGPATTASAQAPAPPFRRVGSSTASPFASPRPSPRLAFTSPIPHSPSLQTYEFSHEPDAGATAANRQTGGTGPLPEDEEDMGEYGSDTVNWLVSGDDGFPSRPASSGAGSSTFDGSSLSAAAAAWTPQPRPVSQQQAQQAEMSPFDMLRSILGETRADAEIEAALQDNGYDLSAAMLALMGPGAIPGGGAGLDEQGGGAGMAPEGQVLIGKNMLASPPAALGQSPGQAKSNIICKYWMATGNCLRADCRFSHEYGTALCRFWLGGNCLAGDSCMYSHDPAQLMSSLNLTSGHTGGGVGPMHDGTLDPNGRPSFQVQDYDAFPQLAADGSSPWLPSQAQPGPFHYNGYPFARPGSARGLGSEGSTGGFNSSPRSYSSRPTSRHSSRAVTPSLPAVDDTDAFPTLGALAGKGGERGSGKKHHGKRGHGHAKENAHPGSLADVVRMSPSPAPATAAGGLLRKGLVKTRSYGSGSGRDGGAVAMAIPPPERIPWLETGERANQAYLKARQEAFKHGSLRNKFLQSAAQAWNRNDARAAKALSLRGQAENNEMRKAHREGAQALYEARNQHLGNAAAGGPHAELYVDLHGLHPEEATAYLAQALREHRGQPGPAARPLYAITGTGHHSKGGKDKVGKAVRGWLAERGVAFREFSVPGDRGNVGGILGIDARTGRLGAAAEDGVGGGAAAAEARPDEDEKGRDTKVRVVKEVPTGPRARG